MGITISDISTICETLRLIQQASKNHAANLEELRKNNATGFITKTELDVAKKMYIIKCVITGVYDKRFAILNEALETSNDSDVINAVYEGICVDCRSYTSDTVILLGVIASEAVSEDTLVAIASNNALSNTVKLKAVKKLSKMDCSYNGFPMEWFEAMFDVVDTPYK